MMRRKQNGGIIWSFLKLLILIVIGFLVWRMDAHLGEKYLPQTNVTTPAKPHPQVQ